MGILIYKNETNLTNIDTKELHELMQSIGVPPNVRGYAYIICALNLILQEPLCIQHITKGLYIDIAKEFHATPCQVERGIRHAIHSTWIYGDKMLLDTIFKNCIKPNKVTPSNSAFLLRLFYYITNREHVK